MTPFRIICIRVGDPNRKPLGPGTELQECCRCGHAVWVQSETNDRAAHDADHHEYWCLECNNADEGPKTSARVASSRGPAGHCRKHPKAPPTQASAPSPPRVPWLKWLGAGGLYCERCGGRASLPTGGSVKATMAFLDALIADHAGCEERPEPLSGTLPSPKGKHWAEKPPGRSVS